MYLEGIKDPAVDIHGLQLKGMTGHIHINDAVVKQTGPNLQNRGDRVFEEFVKGSAASAGHDIGDSMLGVPFVDVIVT